ncbi:MAG: HAD hydrolase-like protein [Candidatus Rokubacteria bacterium]|nr:HAD hydrolase-like protein [Candidatus Rokubacteria bacterium]
MAADRGRLISRRDLVKVTGVGALAAALGANVVIPGRARGAPVKARALFFDVGGTILDWSVMPEKITKFFADRGVKVDGKAFWPAWRTKLFFYMMYNTMIGSGFIPLEELARRATIALTKAQKTDLKPADAGGVLPLLGELDVYPDVMPGLQKMRELGYQLVPHTQLSSEVLKKALLDRFRWDWYFTSETFAVYKPHRSIYLKAIEAMGLDRAEVIYVTSNQFDVFGAKGAGFRTAWVGRWNEPLEPYGYAPDWHVKDFVELAKVLETEKP